MIPAYIRVDSHQGHVCITLGAITPDGTNLPTSRLALDADQALALADQLVNAAIDIDTGNTPPAAPRYRIRVTRGRDDDLWTWSCPAHPETGIGLFHDQPSALASAHQHLTDRHT